MQALASACSFVLGEVWHLELYLWQQELLVLAVPRGRVGKPGSRGLRQELALALTFLALSLWFYAR